MYDCTLTITVAAVLTYDHSMHTSTNAITATALLLLMLFFKNIQGLVLKVEPHTQRVPRSQRGGEVIEPLVSAQWFVKYESSLCDAIIFNYYALLCSVDQTVYDV
jgi:tRNA synthetases class I (I, L, M and V)